MPFQIIKLVCQLIYTIPVFVSICLSKEIDNEYIFGVPFIFLLFPLIVFNILKIIAVGFSTILVFDTLVQMSSLVAEVIGVVLGTSDTMFIVLIGFRLMVLSLRFDNIKTGIKNSRRIPKLSRAMKDSKEDIGKLLTILIDTCSEGEYPIKLSLKRIYSIYKKLLRRGRIGSVVGDRNRSSQFGANIAAGDQS